MSDVYSVTPDRDAEAWLDHALCLREYDRDLWFANYTYMVNDAINICGNCPVLELCGERALRLHVTDGVWAGVLLDPKESRAHNTKALHRAIKRRQERNQQAQARLAGREAWAEIVGAS